VTEDDKATAEEIVRAIATVIEAEPTGNRHMLRLPGGPQVGQQISIDATEAGGLLNKCRLSVLNVDTAPEAEAARVEYFHQKQGKFGVRTVYSVQSVRRRNGALVLLENFLAENPETVREQDFELIASADYAQTVLNSIKDWAKYRAWQLQVKAEK
jgi:hypothetical protein